MAVKPQNCNEFAFTNSAAMKIGKILKHMALALGVT
jgi:hypothetical protein